MKNSYKIDSESNGERLDIWLSGATGETRSQIQKYIKNNLVTVNGKLPKKSGDRIHTGGIVVINKVSVAKDGVEEIQKDEFVMPEVEIIEETRDFIVICKPTGLITHPGAHIVAKKDIAASNTLASWILKKYPKLWGVGEYENRPGIVHRLDKETSGLMVIAKNQKMFDSLKKQFQNRETEKKYYALAHGVIPLDNGRLDFPIDRGSDGKMVSRPIIKEVNLKNVNKILPGKEALTGFAVIKRFINFTLLDINLHTGRTHQIRVHLYAYNHSVVGDKLYFGKKLKRNWDMELGRLFLHAYNLCFNNLSCERKCFSTPMPKELKDFLKKLK